MLPAPPWARPGETQPEKTHKKTTAATIPFFISIPSASPRHLGEDVPSTVGATSALLRHPFELQKVNINCIILLSLKSIHPQGLFFNRA
jgi:hypothetical protein